MNFRALTHLYTTPLVSLLYRQREKFGEAGRIDLTADLLAEETWKAAHNMSRRITRALGEDMAANERSEKILPERRLWVERLAPEAASFWERGADETPKTCRLLLPLETNPACLFHVGVMSQHWEVGTLLWYEHRLFHSFVNYGKFPAIHLFAEFRISDG